MRTGANIHHAPSRDRDEAGPGYEVRIDNQRAPQSTRWQGGNGLGARARLRLTLGMHVLSRLAEDPSFAGRRLPSIRAISIASGHHRNTVAAAYSDLRVLGIVACRRGSGSYASHPPATPWDGAAGVLVCREPELAGLLARELGSRCARPPVTREPAGNGELLLHPLDHAPPADVRCYPIAPSGATLSAIRRLPDRSTAVVASRSRAAGGLMRSAIRAVHGASVAVVCTHSPTAPDGLPPRQDGQAPAVVFHDPGWPIARSAYPHQSMRFLTPGSTCYDTREPLPHAIRNG
jgi:hypothetical protein